MFYLCISALILLSLYVTLLHSTAVLLSLIVQLQCCSASYPCMLYSTAVLLSLSVILHCCSASYLVCYTPLQVCYNCILYTPLMFCHPCMLNSTAVLLFPVLLVCYHFILYSPLLFWYPSLAGILHFSSVILAWNKYSTTVRLVG